MAYIPDERFKNTLYDAEDCLDSITDYDPQNDYMKESEKKKAVKLFQMFLDFCDEEQIIGGYDLMPLYAKLGLEPKIYAKSSEKAKAILIEQTEE